jgi:hypothetical protein
MTLAEWETVLRICLGVGLFIVTVAILVEIFDFSRRD